MQQMRINPIFSSTHLDIPHYFFSYKRPKMKIPVDMGRKKNTEVRYVWFLFI